MACVGTLALAAVFPAAGVCAAAVRIETISVETTAAGTELTVQTNGAVGYDTGVLATHDGRPARIYLDLEGAEIGAAPRLRELATGPVLQVRTGQFSLTRARVVLDLAHPAPYTIDTIEDPFRLVVRVGEHPAAPVAAAVNPAPRTERHEETKSAAPQHSSGPPEAAQVATAQHLPPEAPFSLVPAADVERLRQLAATRRAHPLRNDYTIGPDDLLDIEIPDLTPIDAAAWRGSFGLGGVGPSPLSPAPSQASGVRVSANGEVTLPVIGITRAAGYTPEELADSIEQTLRKRGILRRPEVRVFVLEYRSQVVSVSGAVARPGLYPLTGPEATVGDMLWAAGGPTGDAGRVIDFVPDPARTAGGPGADAGSPTGEDLVDPIHIDLQVLMQQRGDRVNDPPARPGDVISVPPAGNVNVDGWVAKPGAYNVTASLSVAGAVAAAGGPQFPANLGAVEILRTFGAGKPARFEVDLAAIRAGTADDVPVKDGDVIRVPAKKTRLVPWAVWNVARSLIHIGGSVLLF